MAIRKFNLHNHSIVYIIYVCLCNNLLSINKTRNNRKKYLCEGFIFRKYINKRKKEKIINFSQIYLLNVLTSLNLPTKLILSTMPTRVGNVISSFYSHPCIKIKL